MTSIWDDKANEYPLLLNRPSTHKAIEIIERESKDLYSVIDIGCGPGNQTLPFSKLFKKVYAVDNSRPMLDRLNIECVQRSINNVHTIQSECLGPQLPTGCSVSFSCLCPGMYSIEGLKMLDRCSSGLSIFIGPTYDPKCTERRILSELGLDARIPFDTEWLVKEFDHKSNVEYISESHNWTSRENLVNRCLRLTDGTENSKNMLSELIFSMDAEELPVSRNLMIVYWKHT